MNNRTFASLAKSELIPFAIALVIAQIFFKWGSFGLELLGFLALWWFLGYIMDRMNRLRKS